MNKASHLQGKVGKICKIVLSLNTVSLVLLPNLERWMGRKYISVHLEGVKTQKIHMRPGPINSAQRFISMKQSLVNTWHHLYLNTYHSIWLIMQYTWYLISSDPFVWRMQKLYKSHGPRCAWSEEFTLMRTHSELRHSAKMKNPVSLLSAKMVWSIYLSIVVTGM